MKFVSLFSGVGGSDIGFELAGWECVGQVEIDKHCVKILDRHWPNVPKHDDIQTARKWADERELVGAVDVVVGGAPCQDLSIAGKRAGFEGHRSRLVLDMVDFAAYVGSEWIVYENVPGLLTSQKGDDFEALLGALADAGYGHIEWRVLDSQFFGVPQRRRRVFLVARSSSVGGGEVLSEREGLLWHPPQIKGSWQATAASAAGGAGVGSRHVPVDGEVSGTFTQGAHPGGYNGQDAYSNLLIRVEPFTKSRRAMSSEDYETWDQRGVTPTLNSFDNATETRATVLMVEGTSLRTRRLTPVECERLQGFPDGWTEGVSDSQRLKQMGNAITVPVANYVACLINDFIEEQS